MLTNLNSTLTKSTLILIKNTFSYFLFLNRNDKFEKSHHIVTF